MPSAFLYDAGTYAVNTGGIVPGTTALKIMLVTAAYTGVASKADTFPAAVAGELAATGYAGGFGGAGRISAGTVTVTNDTTAHLTKWVFPNAVWGPLGGAANGTIAGAILFKPGTADDTTAVPMAFWPLAAPVPTNGSGFTLTMDPTNGNVSYTN